MRSYGQAWTEEDIKEAVKLVVKDTGITHFPTHKELDEYYGNYALSVILSKTGGTRRWSKILNLPPSACSNTKFGNKYELQAIEDIKQEIGLDSELAIERYPYDIYVENGVKIDIKASMPLKGRNFDCWSFNLEKKMPTCDIYIFYCINTSAEIAKRVIIPSCVLQGTKQVGIGTLSKYDNYIERWDLIKEYSDFLINIKEKIDFIPKRRTTGN
jgi:hypothetical protein